ncbi:MAG: universal stress protein [Deltaproteobacteria bacterium]|nr:universal stress protein [Deltaproteobacteria bacterium]
MVSPYEIPIPEDFIQQTRAAAQNRLSEVVEEAKRAGLYCEGHLLSDRADPGIVMGTRGTSRLRHMFLGSVAERTVRHAPCSVLTVKADPSTD